MRSLICFIITAFISLQIAHASHVEQIDLRALPQDENIINNVSKMKALEPYVEHWVYEWNFKIGRDEVISQINALYNEISGYLKDDSLNGELLLYSGLIAHYAYNLDLQEYWDLAEANLSKARELMKGDLRPDWFLGLHYVQSNLIKEGMNIFLNITKEGDIEDGLFWEDYAMSSYYSQMLQSTLMGLDKAKTIFGKDSDYEELFGKEIRKKISVPGKKSKIEIERLWIPSKSDSLIDFVSFPLGYRISIPAHWKVRPFPYEKRSAVLYIETEPVKGIYGDMVPIITVLTHVAEKKENIEDFFKTAAKLNVELEKYELNLGLNESSYLGIDSVSYPQEGGARIILLYFERDEPEYKGVRLERPQEFSYTSEGANFYGLNVDRVFSRFNGRLFYVIVLECNESIFDKSMSEFKRVLKSFVVE